MNRTQQLGWRTTKDPVSCIATIQGWIRACDALHGVACVPNVASQRPAEDIPRWLIDTHLMCIVPGISAHQYLALSYVWPQVRSADSQTRPVDEVSLFWHADRPPPPPPPRTLLLDESTLLDLQKPGALQRQEHRDSIPPVIKHAMDLVRSLNARYLWVDRLCIVQNNFEDGGTLSQVAKMDKIYSGAFLTIIAAASDSMYDKRVAMDWPTFPSQEAPWVNIWSYMASEWGNERPRNPAVIRYECLAKSKWASRGWYVLSL
jgi:hypothetical protein